MADSEYFMSIRGVFVDADADIGRAIHILNGTLSDPEKIARVDTLISVLQDRLIQLESMLEGMKPKGDYHNNTTGRAGNSALS